MVRVPVDTRTDSLSWRHDTTTQNDGAVQLATTKGGAYDDPERFDHLLPFLHSLVCFRHTSELSVCLRLDKQRREQDGQKRCELIMNTVMVRDGQG